MEAVVGGAVGDVVGFKVGAVVGRSIVSGDFALQARITKREAMMITAAINSRSLPFLWGETEGPFADCCEGNTGACCCTSFFSSDPSDRRHPQITQVSPVFVVSSLGQLQIGGLPDFSALPVWCFSKLPWFISNRSYVCSFLKLP